MEPVVFNLIMATFFPNQDLILGGDQTITGTLTFQSRNILTGPNKLIIAETGSVQNIPGDGTTQWYVNGNLQMNFPSGNNTKSYRIGDASGYRPVDLSLFNTSGSGGITVSTTSGDHPNIGTSTITQTKSVNRFWTFTNNGLTFTDAWPTFNWDPSEVDAVANTANFKVGKYDAPNWTYPTVTLPTDTSIQARGITTFSDFAVGEVLLSSVNTDYFRSISSGNWNDPATWESSPVADFSSGLVSPATLVPDNTANTITIRHDVDITTSISIDNVVIENDKTLNIDANYPEVVTVNDGPGDDIVCNGQLNVKVNFLVNGQVRIASGGMMQWLNEGALRTDNNGTITIDNGGSAEAFSNGGELYMSGGISIVNNGNWTWAGDNYIYTEYNINTNINSITNNGIMKATGGQDFDLASDANLTINNTGTLTFKNASDNRFHSDIIVTNTGEITLENGDTILFNQASLTLGGIINVNNLAQVTGSCSITFDGTDINNNGEFLNDLLIMNGSSAQTFNGTGTIKALKIDNVDDVTIGSGNQTVSGELIFSNGKIVTGANRLVIDDAAIITDANINSSYVFGNVERNILSPGPKDFPIGDLNVYAPITLDPSFTGAGAILARTDGADHPRCCCIRC